MEIFLTLLIGFAIGAVLGTLGAGGGVITVPALVYVLGEPVSAAATASLAVVASNAAAGSATALRRDAVNLRVAALFLVGALPGSVLGAALATVTADELVLGLLSGLMVLAAVALVRRPYSPDPSRARDWYGVPAGLTIGVLTGISGVGGGFLILPVLVLLIGLHTQLAVATSLVVIAVTSASALIARLATGAELPLVIVVLLAGAGALGAIAGRRYGSRLRDTQLDRAFGAVLVILAVAMLVSLVV